jgi:sugar phosphate isomerase/epimerase
MNTRRHGSLGICSSVFGHRHALTGTKLRRLAETGIGWVEVAALQPQHLNVFDSERVEELASALAQTPLGLWAVHAPFCGLAMDDAETRSDGVRRLVQAARVAERLGTNLVVVHPGRDVPSVSRQREIQWTRDGLASALDTAPDATTVALETMGVTSLGGPPEEMLQILDGFAPSRVGVCFDTGHVNTGDDVVTYIRHVADRIVTVHLHDNRGDRDAHALPGEGNLDWPLVLRVLRDSGYGGPLVGECGHATLSPIEVTEEFCRRMDHYRLPCGAGD